MVENDKNQNATRAITLIVHSVPVVFGKILLHIFIISSIRLPYPSLTFTSFAFIEYVNTNVSYSTLVGIALAHVTDWL